MEAQLSFTWNQQPVEWASAAPIQPAGPAEYLELPSQLQYRLAEPPAVMQEKPKPLKFTNDAPKKLVSFGVAGPKKPSKTPKPPAQQPKPPKPARRAEWNADSKTTGLFDPHLSKKVPLDVKLSMKQRSLSAKAARPAEVRPAAKADHLKRQVAQYADSLEVRFLEDQEQQITRLENELRRVQDANRVKDREFRETMKKLEQAQQLDRKIEHTKSEVLRKKQSPKRKPASRPVAPQVFKKPQQNFVKRNIQRVKEAPPREEPPKEVTRGTPKQLYPEHDASPMKPGVLQRPAQAREVYKETQAKELRPREYTEFKPKHVQVMHDTRGGNVHEAPTRDTCPGVLKRPPAPRQMSCEVSDLRPPIDPMLGSVAGAMLRLSECERHVGSSLVSRVSAKYIAYYADELSYLLIDDLLKDVALDLNETERHKAELCHEEFRGEANYFIDELVADFCTQKQALSAKYSQDPPLVLKTVEVEEDPIIYEDKARLWLADLSDTQLHEIRSYKLAFDNFQSVFNNGSKLWEVYAVIGEDLFGEALGEVVAELNEVLEEFSEGVLSHEFN